ncbi:DotU family type IV/VI secretion system protein [Alphaproteobacteria bacterium endosymbiont of Tiliacea citrago]|uniref:DotU family type IV/VI secretion system protein n=1 Tax=Alphaproteobacteria bacterium endosymbiont of Tiliacea citrago TaxID=3077944 RepID=UPI00313B4BD6
MINRKSFLTNAFEEFHQIIFKYRKKIKESSFFNPLDNEEQKIKKIFSIQTEISSFMKTKASEIFHETGKIGGDIFEEVSYIMAALADEIFIFLNWEGKNYWKNNLMEKKIFNSNNSGEVIFDKISEVLKDQSIEAAELSIIYFYCLALGFRGVKAGSPNYESEIQELKSKLYYKIYYKDSKLFKEKQLLFPMAYKSLFVEKNVLKGNSVRFWKRILIGTVLSYLIFVELMWSIKMKVFFDLLGKFISR